jgi:hypothetical protein
MFCAGVLIGLLSPMLGLSKFDSSSAGPLMVEFAGGSLRASFNGIPVIRGSLLQVFTPDGLGGYSSNADPPRVARQDLAGGRYLLTARFGQKSEGRFHAVERIEVDPAGVITMRLEAVWSGERPVYAEWAAAMIWAYPLWDADWQAALPEGARAAGTIAEIPQPNPPLGQILAQGFRDLEVHARPFQLAIRPGMDFPEVLLLDGRSNTAPWAQGDRLFWLGSIRTPLEPGVTITRTLTLSFVPGVAAPPQAASLRAEATLHRLPPPSVPPGPPVLIPQPKRVQFGGEPFRVEGAIPVTVLGRDARLARTAREVLGRVPGARFTNGLWKGRGILIASASDLVGHPRLHKLVNDRGWIPPNRAEGYRLHVDSACAVIVGFDAPGAFYGLQTLAQLMHLNGHGVQMDACEVEDWPSLPFRGAHLFTGIRALPFHKKLIGRIFSRFKLNSLVLECEYTRWATHPEIAADFAMTKKDLGEDVAYTRAHFMEPIPLIQSLGHSQWAFHNGQHLDLAEDRAHPTALCPNNPGTYRLVFDIDGEALKIFKPAYFHIGHDEVNLFGRFPAHPWCLAQGRDAADAASNLFVEDVTRLNGWLRAHGVRTMLWGDMLLSRSEIFDGAANAPSQEAAVKRRAGLPRDVVIADWHYDALPPDRFPSVGVFHKEGLPVVASTWYDPGNIYGFAHAAIDQGAMGLLQTTWAGFNSNEAVLQDEFRQFSAFILAAEYAWSGNSLQPDQLPYRAGEVFKDAWREEFGLPTERDEWWVDLEGAFNDAETRLSPVTPGIGQWRHRQLRLVGRDGAIAVIRLAGKLNSPRQLWPRQAILPFHARARELDFLHACTFPAAGPVAAEYDVVYADGRSATVPVRYGKEIAALDDLRSAWFSDRVCRVTGAAGRSYALRLFRWRNPRPSEPIKEIRLKAVDAVAAPMMAAITCVR